MRNLLFVIAALFSGAGHAQESQVVKLGVLTDMTGPAATNTGAGSVEAAKMAVEDFGGKVLGRSVEILSADFQLKVDVGVGVARRWFDQDKVDAIVDVPSSPLALAVQEVARERKRAFLIGGATTADLTGPACSPYSVHWHIDSYGLGNLIGAEMVKRGGDKWHFLTTDTAFGHSLERDTTASVVRNGGKVVGSVRFPINTPDFSSFLLTASSGAANVIALASTSSDTTNALKQAQEFGLMDPRRGLKFAVPLGNIHDFRAAGLPISQGVVTVDGFYWDANDETRAWSNRFFERMKIMPSAVHASVYSVTLHYLRAIEKARALDAETVIKTMKATAVQDFFAPGGVVREDGRLISDRLLLQVKEPGKSKGEWDVYEILRRVPGDQIFRPLSEGSCPLVAKTR